VFPYNTAPAHPERGERRGSLPISIYTRTNR